MIVTRANAAQALIILGSAVLTSLAWVAPAHAQAASEVPKSDRISSSQFRADSRLLDRHPMEVDHCRLVEHWRTGYCYIYSLGQARKVSEDTDVRCDELGELRQRMQAAVDAGFCAAAPAPQADASTRADAAPAQAVSSQGDAPTRAGAMPAQTAPAVSMSGDESLLQLFLVRLSWVLAIIFAIGWLRWWPALVLPVAYIAYVRFASGQPVAARAYSHDELVTAFAVYSFACLLVLAAGVIAGRRRRALRAAPADSNVKPSFGLPFSQWLPVFAGAGAGVLLRLIYSGRPGHAYAAMMSAFIYLSPLLVGAITVYVAETRQRRSWDYYLWAPFLANILYVVGTLVIMFEGVICAIVILPLFAFLGSIGGLIMGAVCRITRWPSRVVYGLGILPFLLGGIEHRAPLPERIRVVERAITVHAAPDIVWRQIHNVRDIRPDEVSNAWIYRIGVPLPRTGVTQATANGLVRKITMGKDIHFDQVVTGWEENRYVRWTYHFDQDSFPPYALDDHVVLGGHYFDVQDTSYTLTPRGDATELKIHMQYRVSTQFNWYADPIAAYLFGNFEEVILEFYRRRSEAIPT